MQLLKPARSLGLALAFLFASQLGGHQFDAHAKGQRRAIWPKVALIPFTIEPQIMEEALTRSNQDAVASALATEATSRAERLLLLRRVGSTVERITSTQSATAPVIVTGSVSLPLSLPPAVIGWKARARKGVFATTKAVLLDATGKVLAQEEVTLNWGDVWWIGGGKGKAKAQLPLDEVLRKFTRKSVDSAIERLQQKLKTSGVRQP